MRPSFHDKGALMADFDAIVVENAMGYAKLVDCSRIDPRYSDDDMLMLGARLNAYNDTMDAGPLAVFGTIVLSLSVNRFHKQLE